MDSVTVTEPLLPAESFGLPLSEASLILAPLTLNTRLPSADAFTAAPKAAESVKPASVPGLLKTTVTWVASRVASPQLSKVKFRPLLETVVPSNASRVPAWDFGAPTARTSKPAAAARNSDLLFIGAPRGLRSIRSGRSDLSFIAATRSDRSRRKAT